MYQSISISPEDGLSASHRLEVEDSSPEEAASSSFSVDKSWKYRVISWTTFFVIFLLNSYCIFQTFSPLKYGNHPISSHRLLADGDSSSTSCTVTDSAVDIAGGALIGGAVVVGAVILIGLTPVGPVAGGLFAANMGAGLTAGSMRAGLQSAVMTGSILGYGTGFGAAAGASLAASKCV